MPSDALVAELERHGTLAGGADRTSHRRPSRIGRRSSDHGRHGARGSDHPASPLTDADRAIPSHPVRAEPDFGEVRTCRSGCESTTTRRRVVLGSARHARDRVRRGDARRPHRGGGARLVTRARPRASAAARSASRPHPPPAAGSSSPPRRHHHDARTEPPRWRRCRPCASGRTRRPAHVRRRHGPRRHRGPGLARSRGRRGLARHAAGHRGWRVVGQVDVAGPRRPDPRRVPDVRAVRDRPPRARRHAVLRLRAARLHRRRGPATDDRGGPARAGPPDHRREPRRGAGRADHARRRTRHRPTATAPTLPNTGDGTLGVALAGIGVTARRWRRVVVGGPSRPPPPRRAARLKGRYGITSMPSSASSCGRGFAPSAARSIRPLRNSRDERDRLHLVLLREGRLLVDVDLHDLVGAFAHPGDLLDDRPDLLARAAPGRPEVDDDRHVTAQHLGLEGRGGHALRPDPRAGARAAPRAAARRRRPDPATRGRRGTLSNAT